MWVIYLIALLTINPWYYEVYIIYIMSLPCSVFRLILSSPIPSLSQTLLTALLLSLPIFSFLFLLLAPILLLFFPISFIIFPRNSIFPHSFFFSPSFLFYLRSFLFSSLIFFSSFPLIIPTIKSDIQFCPGPQKWAGLLAFRQCVWVYFVLRGFMSPSDDQQSVFKNYILRRLTPHRM